MIPGLNIPPNARKVLGELYLIGCVSLGIAAIFLLFVGEIGSAFLLGAFGGAAAWLRYAPRRPPKPPTLPPVDQGKQPTSPPPPAPTVVHVHNHRSGCGGCLGLCMILVGILGMFASLAGGPLVFIGLPFSLLLIGMGFIVALL